MDELRLLDVRVDQIDGPGLERSILSNVGNRSSRLYAYINVHAVNLARHDRRFREIIDGAYVVYCDGEGVRLGARMLGRRLPPRTVLTYWVWNLCALMEKKGLSVFLLGAREPVVSKAAAVLRERYPHLKLAGWHHGFFRETGRGKQESRRSHKTGRLRIFSLSVRNAAPGILDPRESWISARRSCSPAGSMIEYIAGEKKLTPAWMANSGSSGFTAFSASHGGYGKVSPRKSPVHPPCRGQRIRFGGYDAPGSSPPDSRLPDAGDPLPGARGGGAASRVLLPEWRRSHSRQSRMDGQSGTSRRASPRPPSRSRARPISSSLRTGRHPRGLRLSATSC